MKEVKKIKIGDVCDVVKGSTGIMKAVPGKYPMVTLATERALHEEYQFDCNAVIVQLVSSTGHGHASMKRVHYQEGKFALGSILAAIIPKDEKYLHPKYLHIYLSYFKDELLVSLMRGAANVSLSISSIKTVEIIIPAYDKQLEIIKLEEILSRQKKSLEVELSGQKIIIQKLRQAILQDSIEGKLTVDWRKKNPNVEPASELLKKIKAEKEKLIAEKKIKKEKHLPEISEKEIPFELPKEWEWCRLGDVGLFERGKSKHRPRNDERLFKKGNIPFVQTGDVARSKSNNFQIKSCNKYYNEIGLKQSRLWEENTLCITIAANIAETGFLKMKACFPDSVVGFDSLLDLSISKYVQYFFEVSKKNISDFAPATAQKNINLGIINLLLFPLPPLSEQKVIVEKVETLMQELDKLEAEISQNKKTADSLMQSVLREAFES